MQPKTKLLDKVRNGLTKVFRFCFKPLKPKQYKHIFKIIGLSIFLASLLFSIVLAILRSKGISNMANDLNNYLKIPMFAGLWLAVNSKEKMEDNLCRQKRAQTIQFIFSSLVLILIISMIQNVNGTIVVEIEPLVFSILICYLGIFFVVKNFT